jgi:hypothetical protein
MLVQPRGLKADVETLLWGSTVHCGRLASSFGRAPGSYAATHGCVRPSVRLSSVAPRASHPGSSHRGPRTREPSAQLLRNHKRSSSLLAQQEAARTVGSPSHAHPSQPSPRQPPADENEAQGTQAGALAYALSKTYTQHWLLPLTSGRSVRRWVSVAAYIAFTSAHGFVV